MVFEMLHGYSLYEKVKEKNNTLGDCKSDRVISVNFMQSTLYHLAENFYQRLLFPTNNNGT